MEDPWAAGPSWSTPAKASLPGEEAIRSDSPSFSPTSAIDNSDPWGAPAPAPPATTSAIPAHDVPDSEKEVPQAVKSADNAWHADEGHGGWGEEPETQSTESQAVEQAESMSSVPPPRAASPVHEPVWSLDSPSLPTARLPETSGNSREESIASIPLPTVPDIGTPHRSTSLADLPRHDSPHGSLHSYHSPALSLHEELTGGFGEPSMSKSPSFGDEGFGGFSNGFDSGDPWGGGGGGDEWGGSAQQTSGFAEPEEEDSAGEENDDEGDGWGGSRSRASAPASQPAQESEWEQAQRMIRVKQERAPDEKVEALRKEWEDIAQTMIGMNKLDKPTEEEERQLEEAVRKLQEATAETLRSLGDIPADLNTYPPVVSSLVTHERHVYALSRPNPTPSTSLLNVSLANQSRRQTTLGIQSTDSSPWLSRSKLGEPDSAPADTTAQTDEAPKGRWSFWGKRNVSEKQLTTSGGGVLEVKPLTPTGSGSVRSSVEVRPASIAPSIESQPRPPSPPPPVATAAPTHEDVGHDAPSEAPQGPSVVSRFFGRLSRRPSSQKPNEVDAKDIELSADDFSFLDQVPSITSPPPFEQGMGDLLAMEPGRDEQIAGLESMLAAKPAPLPAPLAPPPRGPSAPVYSRSVSQTSTGGRFVPKMAAPAKKASDMDLLSGLDFADDTNLAPTPPPANLANTDMTSSSLSAWDEFLAPSKPTTRSITPSARSTPPPPISPSPPIIPGPARSVSTSSPFTLPGPPKASSASPGPSKIAPTSQSPPPALPPKTPNIGLGDFDDFGTPQKAIHTATFEDFGDFSAFDEPHQSLSSPFAAPQATPLRSSFSNTATTTASTQAQTQFTTSTPISKHPVLDHTPTIHLVNGASASKGRRWPAPPSPVAPILEPPPPPSRSPAGFPFLSPPPPPSRPTSSLGKAGNNLLGEHDDDDGPVGLFATPIVAPLAGLAPTPPRASTPSSSLAPGSVSSVASSAKGGGGLSAQDLSFFDSL